MTLMLCGGGLFECVREGEMGGGGIKKIILFHSAIKFMTFFVHNCFMKYEAFFMA